MTTARSIAICIVLFACSCGEHPSRIQQQSVGHSEWVGEYRGEIVYALGYVPDRRQGRGLPARMIIAYDGPDIRVEIATAGLGPQWLFFLSPEVFTGNDVEFSRTGVPGQDSRRYTVMLRRAGEHVTGRLSVEELAGDRAEPVSGYFLDTTKTKKDQ